MDKVTTPVTPFGQIRKKLVFKLTSRLNNPDLSEEKRTEFLEELKKLVETLPAI
jgi:hypothetical protein